MSPLLITFFHGNRSKCPTFWDGTLSTSRVLPSIHEALRVYPHHTQVFTYPGAWEGHGQVRGPEEQGSWFAVVERVSTPTNLKFHTGSIQETIPDSTTKKSQQVLPASDNYCAMLTWPCVTKPLPH